MMRNTFQTYGWMARLLHWVMAVGILGMIGVGLWMTGLPSTEKGWVYGLHKASGLTLLVLFLFRLCWRWMNPVPRLPHDIAPWQRVAAWCNHWILYLYMGAMLLSGTFMSLLGGHGISWFGLFQITIPYQNMALAKTLHGVHVTLTDYAWVFIAAHVAIALYHHFVRKDQILRRMMGNTPS